MTTPIQERLDRLSIYEPNSGCRLYLGHLNPNGYGQIKIHERCRQAHRVAYECFVGPIPDGLTLDHLCRNRACINERHLEPVPARVNTLRGFGFPGVNARKTHCLRGHAYTTDNTLIMNNGARRCRQCEPIRRRAAALNQIRRTEERRILGALALDPSRPFCKWGHAFTQENTYFSIRGDQVCRECDRIKARRAIAKRRGNSWTP